MGHSDNPSELQDIYRPSPIRSAVLSESIPHAEFLDLKEKPVWRKRDLEQAILERLGDFLLELGKGFCFVARQKRLTHVN